MANKYDYLESVKQDVTNYIVENSDNIKDLNFLFDMAQDNFTTHGAFCDSIYTAYEIELSTDGSRARVRYSIETTNGIHYSRPKWQDIKFTRSGNPFVTYNHKRLYINSFSRL